MPIHNNSHLKVSIYQHPHVSALGDVRPAAHVSAVCIPELVPLCLCEYEARLNLAGVL